MGKEVQNSLYPFFWQHGEEHEILNDYMEKISASGMKGICVEARPHPDFVGEGWWKDMDFIIGKAKELGMKMWILDDSHFPTGFANGRIKSDYPQYLKKYLDMRRFDVQGPLKNARIDFKLLKGRPWERPDMEEEVFGVYMAKRMNLDNQLEDSIDSDTLLDITGQMNQETRLLSVDVPNGAYSIFVVYQTKKRGEESTKDYLNPLIKEATEVLLEEVYEPHYAHYKQEFGKTIQGFFSDEPRFGNEKGTESSIGRKDMVLPWRPHLEKELGFDHKYLPLLWVNADGLEKDIRFRYMDTVTRLYQENFTKVLGDWCKEHGVYYLGHTIEDNGAHARLGYGTGHYFRGQKDMDFAGIDVIGGQIVPGMGYHHDAFNTGGSNGEFYHYALAKLGASAAHLEERKKGRVMCEAFGAYGWNEGLKMMKWIADHLMVRGVNYLVPHAFDPKKFPDFDCPPHFYAHGHNPQFRYFKVFSNYVNRICSIFKDGIYPVKVGLFYPAELEWAGRYMPVEKPAKYLTQAQISFDIVTRDYLNEAIICDHGYMINGREFEILVMPYGECIPSDTAKVLCAMLKQGVQVIFLNDYPERLVGEDKDNTLLDIVIAKSRICHLETLKDLLAGYQSVKLEKDHPDLTVGEYIRDNQKYYMFCNENIGESIKTFVNVKESGRIYCYDALRNSFVEKVRSDKGCMLELHPYETAIWMVTDNLLDEAEKECLISETEWSLLELPTEWTVSYADSFSYPDFREVVPLNTLDTVQQLEGWEEKCGTLQYKAVLNISEKYEKTVLELGNVFETAEVSVNQQSAGVRICAPYSFELTDYIKLGENELIIEVTNTLGTSIRDAISHYLPIEPFGIQGPVQLKILK